jgi:hypothetical protein
MVGIADLMYGPPTAIPGAVPDPQVSMTSLLTGAPPPAPDPMYVNPQVPPPPPLPAPPPTQAPVATTYDDSPAPGSVASVKQQAQAATEQQPGILAKATDWAKTNPVAVQALMQGFSALASGRTQGGLLEQLGQAAGVGGQSMIEQTAANRELEQKTQMENRKQAESEASSATLNKIRLGQEGRAEALQPTAVTHAEKVNQGLQQKLDIEQEQRNPRLKEIGARIRELNARIANTGDAHLQNQLQLEIDKEQWKYNKALLPITSQAKVDTLGADVESKQMAAIKAKADAEEAIRKQGVLEKLSPEDQRALATGVHPKAAMTVPEITMHLLTKNHTAYEGPGGAQLLEEHIGQIQNSGKRTNQSRQAAYDAARNAVKPGETFIFEGEEKRRGKN